MCGFKPCTSLQTGTQLASVSHAPTTVCSTPMACSAWDGASHPAQGRITRMGHDSRIPSHMPRRVSCQSAPGLTWGAESRAGPPAPEEQPSSLSPLLLSASDMRVLLLASLPLSLLDMKRQRAEATLPGPVSSVRATRWLRGDTAHARGSGAPRVPRMYTDRAPLSTIPPSRFSCAASCCSALIVSTLVFYVYVLHLRARATSSCILVYIYALCVCTRRESTSTRNTASTFYICTYAFHACVFYT